MYSKKNIEFKTKDNLTLRGWLYLPKKKEATPAIIMTHGFSALKEHYLAKFAEVFAEAGFCVLVYDNRNFGDSDSQIPFEVDPLLQVNDMQDAISFLQTLSEVNKNKIGLWGTSFSAGNALVAAAIDDRVKCVVAQVPFVSGHHKFLQQQRPDIWEIVQKRYSADRKGRAVGKPPLLTPVVTDNPDKSAVMKQPEAYQFFTSIAKWKNQVTLKSLENSGEYYPIEFIEKISHIPLLFIVAEDDSVCPASLALAAYEKVLLPKKLIMIKGEHFAPYQEQFLICSEAACEWFKSYF